LALADVDNELLGQPDHVYTVERSICHLLFIYKRTKQHNNSKRKKKKKKNWGRKANQVNLRSVNKMGYHDEEWKKQELGFSRTFIQLSCYKEYMAKRLPYRKVKKAKIMN
jgi:hypothetical protein